MTDMGVDEYRRLVFVYGVMVANPITLKPLEEWTGRLEITLKPIPKFLEDPEEQYVAVNRGCKNRKGLLGSRIDLMIFFQRITSGSVPGIFVDQGD
ncbi:glucose-6-phosphate 1-epimerase [Artemisia annua]|uniref:Glucose-6-phosphate 1-epimerase n=1 Tax=Artemisia annua TaxID=35608 RepID=A0A2U1M992_ARTAN|nr:glucose-6-phosphate 1-epimerase [Artemisia annua]